MGNHRDLNVLIMPDFLKSNPYLNLLHDSLTKKNGPVKINIQSADFNYSLFPVIRTLIRTASPHVLHLHWVIKWIGTNHPNSFKSFIKLSLFIIEVFFLKYFFKGDIVWTAHNVISHECKREKMELMGRMYLARAAKILICHSQSSKKEISRRYRVPPEKIEVIHHGHYIESYKNTIDRVKSREILNISQSDFVFLFFGIIRRYKGLNNLIDNFLELNLDSAKLIIAGYTSDQDISTELTSMIKQSEKIIPIIKFIPDDEIQLLMNASNIVVLPYRKILTSGAAVLAMSYKKSIIGPEMGCLPELLPPHHNFLFDPLNPESLKTSLMDSFIHRKELDSWGQKNYELVKKNSWESVAEKTMKAYLNY